MPDVETAAETARNWVSWGQAAGLVAAIAGATAVGAAIASKALDEVDGAALEDMKVAENAGRRKRLTLEEAEALQQQQQQQQEQQQKKQPTK